MTASTAVANAPSMYNTRAFWDRFWRTAGIQFVAFFIVTSIIYGYQPPVGASADALAAFYGGNRIRILIAVTLSGLNLLNLLWFAASLRTALADTGQDGWGAAATASSAAFGALSIMLYSVVACLAFSIVGSGNSTLTSALNDFTWALAVLTAFPRAMLIMSGAFGLWRAKLISNSLFAAGVAFVVLGVLGGTTWIGGGIWAPDGAFTRFVSPTLLLVWALVVSRVLLSRSAAVRAGW